MGAIEQGITDRGLTVLQRIGVFLFVSLFFPKQFRTPELLTLIIVSI
ncbi:MAG: hypothetical protein P8Y04_11645 [Desulfobulbaceae bacterium]